MYMATDRFIIPVEFTYVISTFPVLPENWIDSDVAADSAWVHGGKRFGLTHSDTEIMARLAYQDVSPFFPLCKCIHRTA